MSRISFFSRRITMAGSSSSFTETWLEIMATRCANRHVEMDSSIWSWAGFMVAIIVVLQFPPRLSLSTAVIIEFR